MLHTFLGWGEKGRGDTSSNREGYGTQQGGQVKVLVSVSDPAWISHLLDVAMRLVHCTYYSSQLIPWPCMLTLPIAVWILTLAMKWISFTKMLRGMSFGCTPLCPRGNSVSTIERRRLREEGGRWTCETGRTNR